MPTPASDRFATTLRALAAPRRAVPIAAVALALVAVQLYYASSLRPALVPLALIACFVVLAPWSWRLWLGERATVSAGAGGAAYALLALAVVVLCGIALPRALGLGPTYFTDAGSLGISAVLYAVGGWGLGRDIELERGLEHARLLALHTHLDPHFLYNTLNAIAEWCAEDAAVAEEAVVRLAAMLRELLAGLELTSWPLHRELALATDLLELHRLRDPGAFDVQLTVDESARDLAVPPLLVLALVENAVKHGPRAGHRGSIALEISLREDGAILRCRVENPGPFAPQAAAAAASGHGLRTLRRRLSHAYRGRASLQLSELSELSPLDAPSPRTRALLELPARGPS